MLTVPDRPSAWAQQTAMNALVIGGNGGIGLGFVRRCLAAAIDGVPQFAQVVATYRDRSRAAPLLDLAAQDQRLQCVAVDVTEESQIQGAIATLGTTRLHLVINTVGVLHGSYPGGTLQPEKSLQHIDPDRLLRSFMVNSIAPILWAKHLLPLLRHEQPSVFATLSAKVGSIGDNFLGGWYGYRASKAALNMLLRTAAIEYRRKQSRAIVVALHPGTTDTPLSEPFQRNVPPNQLFSCDRTVQQLMQVIARLESSDSGQFWNWDGSILPW
jgi:NAD(P)-dependent dehydrogenase (short-subunit alcohol dehydrogenase family)